MFGKSKTTNCYDSQGVSQPYCYFLPAGDFAAEKVQSFATMARKQHVQSTSPLKDFVPSEGDESTDGKIITSVTNASNSDFM